MPLDVVTGFPVRILTTCVCCTQNNEGTLGCDGGLRRMAERRSSTHMSPSRERNWQAFGYAKLRSPGFRCAHNSRSLLALV